MDLIVQNNSAIWGAKTFECSIGSGGVVDHKQEGDGGTPTGRFPFRKVYYRSDRVGSISTPLPTEAIEKSDGWCDDPHDPMYNKHIKLPYIARHEKLWREDHVYDVILVVGHNDAPVIPGKGSAVFVHLRRPEGTPTEGCVALSLENLLEIIEECNHQSLLVVER
jgi:L,D-peptidoglycan transpeptidase YkuD (ErfK/YbiS/YcfS/YnhG family)